MTSAHISFVRYAAVMVICASSILGIAARAFAGETESKEFVYMIAEDRCGVHSGSNENTAIYARVGEGAIIKVRFKRKMADCKEGWFERADGGFICGSHLQPTDARAERPAMEDETNIRDGYIPVVITRKKSSVFKKRSSFERGHSDAVLLKGSVLMVQKDKAERKGKPFYETRQGWFVPEEDCEILPPGVLSLARDVSSISDISEAAKTDSRLSLFRQATIPKDLTQQERWIAVDLEKQLLTAYEGERPIRLMRCSTGERGNTEKGKYRITRKLKQQTMELRMNRVRVEDVQWVMYYDEEESIAIHSAYWHDNFGTPVSHGCVNLPTDDAKWLFDWTAPQAALTDSVVVPKPKGSGTRVIVF
jgi:hypothetical protein